MIDIDKKQQLITEFSQFIENMADTEGVNLEDGDSTIDIFSLYKEFTALKTEVKQESRQFKAAFDSFKDVFSTLQNSHQVLADELQERRSAQRVEVEKVQRETLAPLLLDLIDLRDRLERSVIHHKTCSPTFLVRLLLNREQEFIKNMHEGNLIILRRIEQLLANHEVTMINTLHQPFDPQCMRAVAAVHCIDLPDGVVTFEERKGYSWRNEILQLAEVRVNKLEG